MNDAPEEILTPEIDAEPPPEPRPVGSFYLRFADQAEAEQAMKDAGFWRDPAAEQAAAEAEAERSAAELAAALAESGTPEQADAEAEASDTAAPADDAQAVEQDGEPAPEPYFVLQSFGHAFDIVGDIVQGGQWDDEGNEIEAPTNLPGYHINFSGVLPDGWDAFLVYPQAPVRRLRGAWGVVEETEAQGEMSDEAA